VIEVKRSAIDAESKKRRMWRSRLKRAKSNQVLQRSARSEFLMLRRVWPARPLNTSLDRSEVIEVKRSAVGGESKKRRMLSSWLKRVKSNQVLQRSARSAVLIIPPMPFAAPLNGSVRPSWRDRGKAECRRLRVEEEAGVESLAKENEV
jgi:hypothetical protein